MVALGHDMGEFSNTTFNGYVADLSSYGAFYHNQIWRQFNVILDLTDLLGLISFPDTFQETKRNKKNIN